MRLILCHLLAAGPAAIFTALGFIWRFIRVHMEIGEMQCHRFLAWQLDESQRRERGREIERANKRARAAVKKFTGS